MPSTSITSPSTSTYPPPSSAESPPSNDSWRAATADAPLPLPFGIEGLAGFEEAAPVDVVAEPGVLKA